jgi:histidyl-tRNA synthetase
LTRAAQFNQLGVEFVGCDSVTDDVEAIACAHSVLSSIRCTPPPRLLINTLGTADDRNLYRQQLAQHLTANASLLSPDSAQRLQRGAVLRVLDSKHPADAAVIASAPCMSASMSRISEHRLQAVLHGLSLLNVPFTVDRRLVRGLDYYTSTAFEFVVGDGKACNAVLAGGRYDLGHVLQAGAKGDGSSSRLPAIGWALGVDRFLALFPPRPLPPRTCVTVIAGPGSSAAATAATPSASAAAGVDGDGVWHAERQAALLVCARLRERGLVTVLDTDGGNLKKAMARANK